MTPWEIKCLSIPEMATLLTMDLSGLRDEYLVDVEADLRQEIIWGRGPDDSTEYWGLVCQTQERLTAFVTWIKGDEIPL